MNTRSLSLIAVTVLGGLASACASIPPPPLVEARDAYVTSSKGLASKLTPTDLYDAKKALDKADQEFAEHGDTLECRDYAYIAHRKIELTDVKARTELDRQSIAGAAKLGVVVRDSQAKATQAALVQTRTQLSKERHCFVDGPGRVILEGGGLHGRSADLRELWRLQLLYRGAGCDHLAECPYRPLDVDVAACVLNRQVVPHDEIASAPFVRPQRCGRIEAGEQGVEQFLALLLR